MNDPSVRLTMTDLVAVRRYITEDYALVDDALRRVDAEKLKELDAHIRVATFGLIELPAYRGPVFRGTELPEATLAKYEPGLVVREHGFVSATANAAVRFPGNTTYVIESVNGREVERVADEPIEHEVVFFTGTRFAVLDTDRDPGGDATVYLREIPDARLRRGGESGANAIDTEVLDALRRSRRVRDAMDLRLRFPAGRPDKYAAPIGIDDAGRFFRVPKRPPSEIG